MKMGSVGDMVLLHCKPRADARGLNRRATFATCRARAATAASQVVHSRQRIVATVCDLGRY